MERAFLTARWEDLVLVTYAAPDELLRSRLAPGLELDRWEGRACVSLVGFRFLGTRVRGVRVPRHVDFPEVNLRFYVREGSGDGARRGVMFVREYVPRRAITAVARAVYNEPYRTAPMRGEVSVEGGVRSVSYGVRVGGREQTFGVESDAETFVPGEGTIEHFFKEHRWGYGRSRRGRPLRYEVDHPVWAVHRVRSWSVDVDWVAMYGKEWGVIEGAEPVSVVHAVGSGVVVRGARSIR